MKRQFKYMSCLCCIVILLLTGCESVNVSSQSSEIDLSKFSTIETTSQQPITSTSKSSIDKDMTTININDKTKTLSIENRNGSIDIKQGSGKDIEVKSTIIVDHATNEEALEIASKTKLQVNEGSTLEIKTYSEPYGASNNHYPSIHLAITIPEIKDTNLQVNQKNGNLSLSHVTSIGKIKLSTKNGSIDAVGIGNEVVLETVNGVIVVSEAKKSVQATVTNGNIQADQIVGPLEMNTTNGNLSSTMASSSIKASSVAGNITIDSDTVGGDWDINSNAGNVEIHWPEEAHVEVDGKTDFGVIQTDFPLTVKPNHVTGKIGDGTYKIQATSLVGLLKLQISKAGGGD